MPPTSSSRRGLRFEASPDLISEGRIRAPPSPTPKALGLVGRGCEKRQFRLFLAANRYVRWDKPIGAFTKREGLSKQSAAHPICVTIDQKTKITAAHTNQAAKQTATNLFFLTSNCLFTKGLVPIANTKIAIGSPKKLICTRNSIVQRTVQPKGPQVARANRIATAIVNQSKCRMRICIEVMSLILSRWRDCSA